MPRKRKKSGQCIYCGEIRRLTRDHIPPKSLFGRPRPSNLISVPCCRTCNSEVSKDDEYFKTVLSFRIDTYDHPDVQKILPSVLRSFRKPEKIGFQQSFFKTLREVELRSPSGLYLGATGAYDVDLKRLDRVARRMTMGLFYHEKGYRLPDTHHTSTFSDWVIENLDEDGQRLIKSKLVSPLFQREPNIIGKEVFSYRAVFFDEDPNLSVWLFLFYKATYYLCMTVPRNMKG